MALYQKYKAFKKRLKQKEWFYYLRLYRRKIAFFIPYHISRFYLTKKLGIKITKVLSIVNGVTAIKYAIGETDSDELIKGEKVFIKICVRRHHRNINQKLITNFNKVAKYKDKNINRILFLRQGILLNFIISSFVENFVELGDFIKSKEFKNKTIRKKIEKELIKMIDDLKHTKIVHNDIHAGNIIVVKDDKKLYLALTDFSVAKQYSKIEDWKKAFQKTDYLALLKIEESYTK